MKKISLFLLLFYVFLASEAKSQSMYLQIEGGIFSGFSKVKADEGRLLKPQNAYTRFWAGKAGIVSFLKKKRKPKFGIAVEVSYSQANAVTFSAKLNAKSFELASDMQSYGFNIKSIVRPFEKVYVSFPIGIVYNSFSFKHSIDASFSNSLHTYQTFYAQKNAVLGLSTGISIEICLGDFKNAVRKKALYKGFRAGISTQYQTFFSNLVALDMTYSLPAKDKSSYYRAFASSHGIGSISLYVSAPFNLKRTKRYLDGILTPNYR